MSPQEREDEKERQKGEMNRHLADLAELCQSLLAARDAFSVYNSAHKLKSLVGQIEANSNRYRRLC